MNLLDYYSPETPCWTCGAKKGHPVKFNSKKLEWYIDCPESPYFVVKTMTTEDKIGGWLKIIAWLMWGFLIFRGFF